MGRKKLNYTDTFLQESGQPLTVSGDTRKRNWFLTINQNADCYNSFVDSLLRIEKDKGANTQFNYAYIAHFRDTMSKQDYERKCLEIERKIRDKFTIVQTIKDDSGETFEVKKLKLSDTELQEQIYIETSKLVITGEPDNYHYAFKLPHYHVLLSFSDTKTWNWIKTNFSGCHVEPCQSVGHCYSYLTHETIDCEQKHKTKYDTNEIVTNNRDYFESVKTRDCMYPTFDINLIAKYIVVDKMYHYIDFDLVFGSGQLLRYINAIKTCLNEYSLLTDNFERTDLYRYNDENGEIYKVNEEDIMLRRNDLNDKFSNVYSVKLNNFNFDRLFLTTYGRTYMRLKYRAGVPFTDFEKYFLNVKYSGLALDLGIKEVNWALGLPSADDVVFVEPVSYRMGIVTNYKGA